MATILAAGAAWTTAVAWPKAELREMYLPQLEERAATAPGDGRLLALLGGRLAQTHDVPDSRHAATVLTRAVAAGENRPLVWQTIAAIQAFLGDRARAVATLQAGRSALHDAAPDLDAALGRMNDLGPNADPMALAAAACPDGPDALVAAYAPGSWLSGVVETWGRGHPEQSGFATRERWAEEEPDSADAQRLWGLALLENRRAPEALGVLDHAVALDPASHATRVAHARALSEMGQPAGAIAELLGVLQQEPRSVPALVALGNASLQAGMELTRPAFLRATQLDPDSADAWIGLGRSDLFDADAFSEALQALQHAVRLAPSRLDDRVNYADALGRNGRATEAEQVVRDYLAGNPDDARAQRALGDLLQGNSPTPARLADAEAHTREAVRLAPPGTLRALAGLQLGQILLTEGKPQEAIAALQAASADDPSDPGEQRLLARAYLQIGDTARAVAYTTRARQTAARHQRVDLLLHRAAGRYPDPSYHRELSDLYRTAGNSAAADHEQHIAELLTRDPAGAASQFHTYQDAVQKIFHFRPNRGLF